MFERNTFFAEIVRVLILFVCLLIILFVCWLLCWRWCCLSVSKFVHLSVQGAGERFLMHQRQPSVLMEPPF